MIKKPQRRALPAEELAQAIQDFQERADELQGDIHHLLSNHLVGEGPYAQLSYSSRNLRRAVSSMEIGARLAQEAE